MSTPTPGRRVAQRQRQRPRLDRGAISGLALVVVAGALLATSGVVDADPEPVGAPETVPVDQVAMACLGSSEAGSGRAVTLAAPVPQAEESAGAGGLLVGPVGEEAREIGSAPRGELTTLDAPSRGSAVGVTATGDAAVGRASFQVDTADGAGLAVQECLAPHARWWFTGGGAGLDHQSRLVMANLDPGPAVVDVVVHGPDGVAEDVATRGITIAPGETRTVELVEVAPQADELAVHVEASRGRVVAGLSDAFATTPAAEPGQEWVPFQAGTARTLRLSPLPRRADRRTLVLANPSEREALVDVEVAGESGSFAPTGAEQVRVPAGSVVTADLSDAVGRDASAVVLQSQVPVTATVRSSLGSDVAYASAAPALSGPAAALLEQGARAEVQLTAGAKGGAATATAYSANGEEVDSTELEVPPTATIGWSPKGKAAYVVVTPTRGDLAGGVSVEGDAGVAQVVLRPLPIVLEQPVVVPVVG